VKILGISASCRKWGNTEILIRHVLQGAAEQGAEIQFLRLTDFTINQCKGCLTCLFKDRDCIIRDDFAVILKALRQADGVVLGSPIHNLFAAGSVQMLTARLFRQAYHSEFSGKVGVVITIGGMPGWEGWALPQLVSFFLSLGMPLVDQFIGYGQGPGEIFYDIQSCNRAIEAGKLMAGGETNFRGCLGTCPVCHCDLVFTHGDGRPHCMLCDIPGTWIEQEGIKRFVPLSGSRPRWQAMQIRDHFDNLILPSGKRFLGRKEEIQAKLDAFRKGAGGSDSQD
jgi:multimeric flavodoxin WrbA